MLQLLQPGSKRELGAAERVFVAALGIATGIALVAIAFGFYADRRITLYLFLAAILSVAFLTTTGGPSRPRGSSPIAWAMSLIAWAAAFYFVARMAAKRVKVALTGQGADEPSPDPAAAQTPGD